MHGRANLQYFQYCSAVFLSKATRPPIRHWDSLSSGGWKLIAFTRKIILKKSTKNSVLILLALEIPPTGPVPPGGT